MLYSRKGDDGKTSMFKCAQRISKSSGVVEALGALDEVNSFLGLCKVKAHDHNIMLKAGTPLEVIIAEIQNILFIIQAELAGFTGNITEDNVIHLENVTNSIEKELPKIKSFLLTGGTELAALLDVARTLARKAERRTCRAIESGEIKVGPNTRAYLNRLSSVLYACVRLVNQRAKVVEQAPRY